MLFLLLAGSNSRKKDVKFPTPNFHGGTSKRIVLANEQRMTNEGENTHAKPIAGEINSV
jgi:hypothetical protein